jgi:hypothetical protein
MQGSFVFSPRLDALSFYLPLLVGLSISLLPVGEAVQSTVLFAAICVWFCDAGHVFATAVPVLFDRRVPMRFGKKIWLLPVLVIAVWFTLNQFAKGFFVVAFGYMGLYHVVMQQYGWMKILLRRSPGASKWEDHLDLAAFWSVYLAPIVFWHTGLSVVGRKYYHSGDLALVLPIEVWRWVLPVHAAILCVFLLKLVWDFSIAKKDVLGKFLFLLYGWLWFYGGLVLARNSLYFWIVLGLTHGIAYHVFVNTYWRRAGTAAMPEWFTRARWKKIAIYVLAITVVSKFWMWATPALDASAIFPIYWIMTMSHHAFDSILWRKRAEVVA